ncbi:MAG: hypothetical protein R3D55_13890 [Chloroflexota bacterium]
MDDQKTLQCVKKAVGDPEQALASGRSAAASGVRNGGVLHAAAERHPVLQIIRRGTCVVENKYFTPAGEVRLVNLASALRKIRPVARENRLQHSHLARWTGRLTLDAGEQQACGWKTAVSPSPMPPPTSTPSTQARLWPACSSAPMTPTKSCGKKRLLAQGWARNWRKVLFPNRHPRLSQWDEF